MSRRFRLRGQRLLVLALVGLLALLTLVYVVVLKAEEFSPTYFTNTVLLSVLGFVNALLILGLLGLSSYEEARALSDSALAKGGSREVFGGHRALADSAIIAKAPPGSIRVRVVPPGSR